MKQININIPEGCVIDTEKSNLKEGRIVFKKKEVTPWKETKHLITGYFINSDSKIVQITQVCACNNTNPDDRNIFATKKQARSMLAMAQLSQIIANDERFGGPVTDEEWDNIDIAKYCISKESGYRLLTPKLHYDWQFLAFHTPEQRDLFLEENKDLIRQYYMID